MSVANPHPTTAKYIARRRRKRHQGALLSTGEFRVMSLSPEFRKLARKPTVRNPGGVMYAYAVPNPRRRRRRRNPEQLALLPFDGGGRRGPQRALVRAPQVAVQYIPPARRSAGTRTLPSSGRVYRQPGRRVAGMLGSYAGGGFYTVSGKPGRLRKRRKRVRARRMGREFYAQPKARKRRKRRASGATAAPRRRKRRVASAAPSRRKGTMARRRKGRKLTKAQRRAISLRNLRKARAALGRGRRRGGAKKSRRKGRRRATPAQLRALAKARRVRRATGRRGRYSPKYVRRARRKANRRSKKHLRAVRTILAGQKVAGLVRRNPRTGELEIMPRAVVANPRRRRRRNPRRRSIARNPGGSLMRVAKSTLMPMAAGAAGGVAAGIVDARFVGNKPMMSALSKVALGVAGAYALRRKPNMAYAFAGGAMGTLGYSFGLRMSGGFVAPTVGTAIKGLADIAAENPELEAMLGEAEDVADLVAIGDIADGEAYLADEDEMADLVVE
jgi:hypothetical protein